MISRSRQRILHKQTASTTDELVNRLRRARRDIAARVERIHSNPRLATNAGERDALYREIASIYADFAKQTSRMLDKAISDGAQAAHSFALDDLRRKGERAAVRFDERRIKRYWELIHPSNAVDLVAVRTQSMAMEDIRALRTAAMDTFRQAQASGWTSREIHKNLQQTWGDIARNLGSHSFVDAAGKPWSNAHYLSMLTRTTLSRVARESYMDTMIEHGDELAIIQTSGENCPVCDAWAGLVVSMTGKDKRYPSYQQAIDAGMFHPNCDCSLEGYVEAVDGEEGKRQAGEKNVDWDRKEAVQEYNDRIHIAEKREAGMTAREADIDLKRDKLRHRMEVALLGDRKDVVDRIPDAVLEKIPQDKLPRFEFSKKGDPAAAWNRLSERGGVIHVDRRGDADQVLGQIGELFGKVDESAGFGKTTLADVYTSADEHEYQRFLRELKGKYGDDQLYSKATDSEFERLEKLENEYKRERQSGGSEPKDAGKRKVWQSDPVSAMTQEKADKMWSDGEQPPGDWYVHGRRGMQELRTDYQIQFTKNWEVAEQYAGLQDGNAKNGSVWMAKPKKGAKVADFTSESSNDFRRLKMMIRDDIEKGGFPLSETVDVLKEQGLSVEDIVNQISSEYIPENIVDTAKAYDNSDFIDYLKSKMDVDFVKTPDGAVALSSDALDAIPVNHPDWG